MPIYTILVVQKEHIKECQRHAKQGEYNIERIEIGLRMRPIQKIQLHVQKWQITHNDTVRTETQVINRNNQQSIKQRINKQLERTGNQKKIQGKKKQKKHKTTSIIHYLPCDWNDKSKTNIQLGTSELMQRKTKLKQSQQTSAKQIRCIIIHTRIQGRIETVNGQNANA